MVLEAGERTAAALKKRPSVFSRQSCRQLARRNGDVQTFDDIADVTAPTPVEPGDVVATAEDVYSVEVETCAPGHSTRSMIGSGRSPRNSTQAVFKLG